MPAGAPVVRRVCIFPGMLRLDGTAQMMLNLGAALLERGVEVDLFLTHEPGALDYMVPAGANVTVGRRGNVASFMALLRYLRTRRPDALISAHHAPNVVAVVARALARVRTRVVVTVHNDTRSLAAVPRGLRRGLMVRAMTLTYPRADAIVAVSKGVADNVARDLGVRRKRISVIYNPTVTESVLAAATSAADHPWLAERDLPVILGVGRLVPQKDFATLIRAFALLRRELPSRLIILGEGADRPMLEALTRELGLEAAVSLPGAVPSAMPYIAKSDVLVASSRWEGLPTVLIEALAVGTPVVSTDSPSGAREILDDGRYGRLTPVGDPRALAEATLDTLRDPPPRGDLMLRGRMFSDERAANEYLELLARLL